MKTRFKLGQIRFLICLVLGLITLALYLPALSHGFVEYDDQQYVTENPRVQGGLTVHGFIWAFGFHASNWHPLTWLSHMLDCQIYGASAAGHHLTNIMLHVASTLLLFLALNHMTGARWRSAAVAALFAWHPLHVESVAWIAERKDVLCAFFWMLTLYAYARYAAKPTGRRYGFTIILFALCLMAKPMAVTLPFVLLLLDYWPLNRSTHFKPAIRPMEGALNPFPPRSGRQLILEKVPFLGLALGACALTVLAQQQAIVSTAGLPIRQRITHALAAYVHYLGATFFPRHLAAYYPYETHIAPAHIFLAVAIMGLFTVLVLIFVKHRPYLATGWFWYVGTLVPVIGLVQVGDQAWADRYTYLPLIGIFMALVWTVAEFVKQRWILQSMATAAAVAMLTATAVQLTYWKNTNTLFDHAFKVTHENFMAATILGSQLAKQGKLTEAMADYRLALQYKPTFPEAHFFLGNAFDEQGELDEAIMEYKKALWFKPIEEQTHIFLGIVLAKQGNFDEAAFHYAAALKLNPDSAVTHNNLARLRHTQGRFDEAIEHYKAAIEIDPKLALAHNNLGILLLQKGVVADGTFQLREALRLNPTNAQTQFNLALALNQQAQWHEAAGLFAKTVNATSGDAKAHCEFANALVHLKKTREAMGQYASALLLQPDFPEALEGLAWILATSQNSDYRNGSQAFAMAQRACELTAQKDPNKLKTLAAAQAELGRFTDAVTTMQNVKSSSTNPAIFARQDQLMLEQFQQSKPWREP